jgi:hypothetical protein
VDKRARRSDKGFYYVVSAEKIRWWRAVSPKQKLEWLEEANIFLRKTLSPDKQRIMALFRNGEI